MLDLIAFDADDTLWYTEYLYVSTREKLERLLEEHYACASTAGEGVAEALHETEMRNLARYGYGLKPFALSMIETAVRLTGGRIRGDEVNQIVGWLHEALDAEVKLMDGVKETVAALSRTHTCIVVTKGDLVDQEAKLARSGLAGHFAHCEILPEKTPQRYRALLNWHSVEPDRFLMVGNSLRSDVLPVAAIGGHAVHIPAAVTWVHEQVYAPGPERGGYHELAHIGLLPALVRDLENAHRSGSSYTENHKWGTERHRE
jgi:putative hydrolase of the HAD superfamily